MAGAVSRQPRVFGVGTVGEIGRVEELPDGRFNLVLRGLREFVIHRELSRHEYREAVVSWRPLTQDSLPAGARRQIASLVVRYLERIGRAPADRELVESGVEDEVFVNFLAQHLDVDPLEKQALLEAATLAERGRRLMDVLEFRLEELRSHPAGAPAAPTDAAVLVGSGPERVLGSRAHGTEAPASLAG